MELCTQYTNIRKDVARTKTVKKHYEERTLNSTSAITHKLTAVSSHTTLLAINQLTPQYIYWYDLHFDFTSKDIIFTYKGKATF